MIYTNKNQKFKNILDSQLKKATAVDICVGFCGYKTVQTYHKRLESIAKKGRVRLILGMYKGEGAFSKNLYAELKSLHEDLERADTSKLGSGVFICLSDYHGKVYVINQGDGKVVLLGSNNFSDAGLATRLEACNNITDPDDIAQLEEYADYLCSDGVGVSIDKMAYTQAPSISHLHSLPTFSTLPKNLSYEGEIRRVCRKFCVGLIPLKFNQGIW